VNEGLLWIRVDEVKDMIGNYIFFMCIMDLRPISVIPESILIT
jgi:hypothetical protein